MIYRKVIKKKIKRVGGGGEKARQREADRLILSAKNKTKHYGK